MSKWVKTPVNDTVALAFFSGIPGTLIMYCLGIPLYFLKVANWIYLLYSIELFVTNDIARSTYGFLSGVITGLIAGGALSFGFVLLIRWTGSNWYWLKVVSYGFVIWFLWVGVARNFLGVNEELRKDLTSNLVMLSQSILYSISTAYIMTKISTLIEDNLS